MSLLDVVLCRAWNLQLGKLSNGTISFANWAPDMTSRKDTFWGDSPTYSGKYKSAYTNEPTSFAAGEPPAVCSDALSLRGVHRCSRPTARFSRGQ